MPDPNILSAVLAEREACCRDVCPWCADGLAMSTARETPGFHVAEPGNAPDENGAGPFCLAWLIRMRGAQQAKG